MEGCAEILTRQQRSQSAASRSAFDILQAVGCRQVAAATVISEAARWTIPAAGALSRVHSGATPAQLLRSQQLDGMRRSPLFALDAGP